MDPMEEATALAELLRKLPVPCLRVFLSTLGGEANVSVMLTVSLDSKETWAYGILENSRFARLSLNYPERSIDLFSGDHRVNRFRKTRFKTPQDAVAKIEKWLGGHS